jgi:hypothetical protein
VFPQFSLAGVRCDASAAFNDALLLSFYVAIANWAAQLAIIINQTPP